VSDESPLRQPSEARPASRDEDLDYRFTLANERTFLAWFRTALALIGGGLAVDQLLPDAGRPKLRVTIAGVLLVLGAATAVHSATRWARIERQMRSGGELPPSRFPGLLAGVLAIGGLLLMVVVLFGGDR
jgi:putative membrane protein